MHWTAIVVFLLLFGGVTVMGFLAAHWRRGDLDLRLGRTRGNQ